ncbi:MAG: tryptophan synthase subunit alpha [Pseudomonadota bacterium]
MKSLIQESFDKARAAGECAFIPYLTAGFPNRSSCLHLLTALAQSGADVIEVGLPFSDPLADGPTIQWAAKTALDGGTTTEGVFTMVEQFLGRESCPVVLMSYFNPILRMGPGRFAARAWEAGVSGVIVPDLPIEEADEWMEAAQKYNIDTILMAAPTTTPERAELIASRTRGFLYYVSMTGVTGSAFSVSDRLLTEVREIRRLCRMPVAVGFGISRPAQAAALVGTADGVVVGSAIIREIQAHETLDKQLGAANALAVSIKSALSNGKLHS